MAEQDPQSRRPPGLLRAVGVSRSVEGVEALAGVELELARSEVVGLIGPNGAGKTTLVNVITGSTFRRPEASSSRTRRDPLVAAAARAGGLARTFQHGHAFKGLTVRENVEVAASGSARRARRPHAGAALARCTRPRSTCGRERQRATARRRAQARRRARARDRAALRPDGRACGRAHRSRGAGARCGRALGARRARRRRPPDRPQRDPDPRRLRPDPGARPGADARRRHAGRDPEEHRRRERLPRRQRAMSEPALVLEALECATRCRRRFGGVDLELGVGRSSGSSARTAPAVLDPARGDGRGRGGGRRCAPARPIAPGPQPGARGTPRCRARARGRHIYSS